MARDHARIQLAVWNPPPMPPGVDTGRPCPTYWDGTIKRRRVPSSTKRALALRYGATPGIDGLQPAVCQYCPATGSVWWPNRLNDGKPGAWVAFQGLSLDHVIAYSRGGSNIDPDNFVLACKSCNSSKHAHNLADWLAR